MGEEICRFYLIFTLREQRRRRCQYTTSRRISLPAILVSLSERESEESAVEVTRRHHAHGRRMTKRRAEHGTTAPHGDIPPR